MNRPLLLSRPKRSAQMRHRAGSMIADAVRYMSVHSWKQPDSHGHSGTSQPRSNSPRDGEFPAHGPFPQVVAGVGFEPT